MAGNETSPLYETYMEKGKIFDTFDTKWPATNGRPVFNVLRWAKSCFLFYYYSIMKNSFVRL